MPLSHGPHSIDCQNVMAGLIKRCGGPCRALILTYVHYAVMYLLVYQLCVVTRCLKMMSKFKIMNAKEIESK